MAGSREAVRAIGPSTLTWKIARHSADGVSSKVPNAPSPAL